MNYQVISTLDCWRCAQDSDIKNIDVSMEIWSCTILLLHWRNSKIFFDGSQSKSYDRRIFWHQWKSSSVGGCVASPQVDPSIFIGMNRYSDASIPRFLCGLVKSSHIWTSKLSALVWVYQWFFILFPNYKPCTNFSITTSPESSVNTVTPVHIGTLICSSYYGRNGDTVRSSKVNDIGQKLDPKQWVSSWLSISVADALQITLSWFLCTLSIIWGSPQLMLNTTLFKFYSGTRSYSKVFVTRFSRRS